MSGCIPNQEERLNDDPDLKLFIGGLVPDTPGIQLGLPCTPGQFFMGVILFIGTP